MEKPPRRVWTMNRAERDHVARTGGRPGRQQDTAAAAHAGQPEHGHRPGTAGTGIVAPAAWNTDSQDACKPARRPSTGVRRASLSGRLKPFLDESSTNELLYPNKADRPWRYIVLHHSASATGNYDQIDGEHRKLLGIDGCGYHFVIGNGTGSADGQIEVSQRWNNQKQGAHTRNATHSRRRRIWNRHLPGRRF